MKFAQAFELVLSARTEVTGRDAMLRITEEEEDAVRTLVIARHGPDVWSSYCDGQARRRQSNRRYGNSNKRGERRSSATRRGPRSAPES